MKRQAGNRFCKNKWSFLQVMPTYMSQIANWGSTIKVNWAERLVHWQSTSLLKAGWRNCLSSVLHPQWRTGVNSPGNPKGMGQNWINFQVINQVVGAVMMAQNCWASCWLGFSVASAAGRSHWVESGCLSSLKKGLMNGIICRLG